MIRFAHLDRAITLTPGQAFSIPRDQGFRDTATADLESLIAEIDAGRPWREAVQARYATTKSWLHRIITEPCRTAFFADVLPADPGLSLDIGAGWGQTSRALAARHPVVALEPVTERLAFIQSAARQDGVAERLTCIGADYFDIRFETVFTTICAIGVLEWVGAFQNHTDPQQRQRDFLRKVRAELAPGGCFVLGIENRLGLKYLLGCPDDHIGVPHIASLPAPLARHHWLETGNGPLQAFTYSLPELKGLLRGAGFTQIDVFGAFPDYKVPEHIIPFNETGAELNAWLSAQTAPPEHNGYNGAPLDAVFQQTLQTRYRTLAATGAAHHFAPSYFIRAA
jgi:SAM-dependent methyltransferase